MGNTSMDDTAAAMTFFFPTDSKSIVPILSIVPFVIQPHVERLPYLSIYIFKRPSSSPRRDFVNGILNMEGSNKGEAGGTSNARDAVIELYILLCLCIKTMQIICVNTMYCCANTVNFL
jgi:hypothetical protein